MKIFRKLYENVLGRNPNPTDDVAGFVVQDKKSGQIVHHEVFESGHLSARRLADKMIGKAERLERRFPPERYEVEHGVFNNRAAFYHFFPKAADIDASPKD